MKKIIFLFIMSASIAFATTVKKSNVDAFIFFDGSDLDYVSPQITTKLKGQKIKWKVSKSAKIEICIKDGYIWPFIDPIVMSHNLKCLAQVNANKIEATILDFKGFPIPSDGYIEVWYSVFYEDSSGNFQELDPVIRIY